jgi:hypothetical protein
MLATSLLLEALAFAIIMLAAHPTAGSLRGTIVALWICGILTTLIGAFFGGWVSGSLPGNPRMRIGAVHGFVSWGLALILSFVFNAVVLGAVLRTATTAGVETASAALQTTGAAAGGAAAAGQPLDVRAEQTLMSLGYTRDQARRMVTGAQGKATQVLQGGGGANAGRAIGTGLASAGRTVLDSMVAVGWTWFGTWFVSLFLAVAGGVLGATRVTRAALGRRREVEVIEHERHVGPLTPAPSA